MVVVLAVILLMIIIVITGKTQILILELQWAIFDEFEPGNTYFALYAAPLTGRIDGDASGNGK
jgi:hypothetical protein